MASVGDFPHAQESMPNSSKLDLQLAKSAPISSHANNSGITYLKSEKKTKNKCAQLQPKRGARICERNNYSDTRVSEKGERIAQVPLQPVVKTVVRQLFPCSLWRSTVEQRSPWSSAPCWSRWIPEGGCDPVGNPCWNRVLSGPCGERSPVWSIFAGKTCVLQGT